MGIRLSPSTGVFTGRYVVGHSAHGIYGVVLQGSGLNYGQGFARDPVAAGSVILMPKP